MYTKKQIEVVKARVERDGMAGLLKPPPRSTMEKLVIAAAIVVFSIGGYIFFLGSGT